jgi:hypothetical protein
MNTADDANVNSMYILNCTYTAFTNLCYNSPAHEYMYCTLTICFRDGSSMPAVELSPLNAVPSHSNLAFQEYNSLPRREYFRISRSPHVTYTRYHVIARLEPICRNKSPCADTDIQHGNPARFAFFIITTTINEQPLVTQIIYNPN